MKTKSILLGCVCALLAFSASAAPADLVSAKIVEAMKSGKFYMKMAGTQHYSDEGMNINVTAQFEVASRGGVSMSRVSGTGVDVVSLTTDQGTFTLDEKNKTWQSMPSQGDADAFGSLSFVRRGTCKVNKQDGWYFEEYKSPGGNITFYFRSPKVELIDMGTMGGEEQMGPMYLHTFTTTIPSNMYFCVGNDWKASGGNAGGALPGGVDVAALEQQMRDELKGAQLPPGMTVDDIINQALGSVRGKAGAGASAAGPKPPVCSKPWQDSGTGENLACGSGSGVIAIAEKQTYTGALNFKTDKPKTSARSDINITEEGIRLALEMTRKDIEGMTDQQVCNYFMDFDDKAAKAMEAGLVTGELVEMSIVHSYLHPHPLTLITTSSLLDVTGKPQEAEKVLEIVDQVIPDNIMVENNLVNVYMEQGKFDKARKVVPKIINVYRNDGQAYLRRAQLKLLDEDYYGSADDLFQSLALGWFEEASATLIFSLLGQIDASAIQSVENVKFMDVLDRVFSEKNLGLLRQAIMFDHKNANLSGKSAEFGWNFSPSSFLGNAPSLSRTAEALRQKADQYGEMADKIMGTDVQHAPYTLYWAMGLGGASAAYGGMYNATMSLNSVQNAMTSKSKADAQKAYDKQMSAAQTLEGSYKKVSELLALQGGVTGFYLKDARTFWCLYALNRYHEWRVMFNDGAFCDAQDKNNDTYPDTFKGSFPDAVRTKYLSNVTVQKAHAATMKDINERYEKIIPKSEIQILQIMINRGEEELAADTKEETGELLNSQTHYNSLISDELEYWYKDMTKYSKYCTDPQLQLHYQYKAFSGIYDRYAVIYEMASSSAKKIIAEQDNLNRLREQLAVAKVEYQKAKQAELLAAVAEARAEETFTHSRGAFLNDIMITVPTPLGQLKFGMADNKFGWVYQDDMIGRRYGNIGGRDFSEVIYTPITKDPVAYGEMAKKRLGETGMADAEALAKRLIKGFENESTLKHAMTLAKAASGELIKFENDRWTGQYYDSAGNAHRSSTTSNSASVGDWTVTSETRRVGPVSHTKGTVTYNAPLGLKVSVSKWD